MTGLGWLLLAAGLMASAGLAFFARRRERQLVARLTAMVNLAMAGSFTEKAFDETTLSALESRMVRYLAAGATSAHNLAAERDRIRQLIADISHQTKTPIANLLLYSQLLSEGALPPECRVAVDALQRQAEKLHFLIGSLVKLSRLETGIIAVTPRRCPLAELLEEAVAQIAPKAAARGIALTVAPPPEGMEAFFDPKWTVEALYNLLDNAVKYTPQGGAVHLSATGYELFCRLDVTDTGMGIPETEHSRVFTRFYRCATVAEQEGVGIGLFLTRQIATAQGGYLKLRSKPGQGSTFSLFLPRSMEAGSPATEGIRTLPEATDRKEP